MARRDSERCSKAAAGLSDMRAPRRRCHELKRLGFTLDAVMTGITHAGQWEQSGVVKA